MKKTLVIAMGVAALALGSLAYAAPREMSLSALDSVSAGQSLVDWLVGDGVLVNQPSSTGDIQATEASGNQSQAVSGQNSANKAAGAVADNGAQAINGDDNLALVIYAQISVPISDSFNTTTITNDVTADAEGAVAIVGDDNCVTTTYDDSEIDVEVDGDLTGVVARYAKINDSFNTKTVTIDVDVDITDSFNVTDETNTLSISGQCGLTAIVNANTLGDQLIGACLNVTNATASTPNGNTTPSLGDNGNATAATTLTQTVINASVIVFGGFLTDGALPDVTGTF